jgi:hypothetical protein
MLHSLVISCDCGGIKVTNALCGLLDEHAVSTLFNSRFLYSLRAFDPSAGSVGGKRSVKALAVLTHRECTLR